MDLAQAAAEVIRGPALEVRSMGQAVTAAPAEAEAEAVKEHRPVTAETVAMDLQFCIGQRGTRA